MAAIKIKNFLHLAERKRKRLWDELRDEPYLQTRVFVRDIFPVVPAFVRFSVGAHGLAVFLIGDDPGVPVELSPLPHAINATEDRRAEDQDTAIEKAFVKGKLPEADRRAPNPSVGAQ